MKIDKIKKIINRNPELAAQLFLSTSTLPSQIKKIGKLIDSGEIPLAHDIIRYSKLKDVAMDAIENCKSNKRCLYLAKKGYKTEELPMGSGGVGQQKIIPTKREIRIQLTYGKTQHNYADAVIFNY